MLELLDLFLGLLFSPETLGNWENIPPIVPDPPSTSGQG
jgi:hypothetical protein